MSERQETVRDVCAEMNGNEFDDPHLNADGIVGARILAKDWAKRILVTYEREMAAKDAEIARLKHILKSSCRWIKCHDIYHTSGADILKEAKEILHDDGEFLFKKGE